MYQKNFHGTASLFLALALALATTMPALAAPPANDDFVNAQVILSLPLDETLDTTEAGVEDGEPNPWCAWYGPITNSVWYAFTPAADGTYSAIIPVADFTPVLSAFTGDSLSSLAEFGCQWDVGHRVLFHADAGTTYYFQVSALYPWDEGGSVQFDLELLPPPANDGFADAIAITSPPFDDTVDTSAATLEEDEPTPSCSGGVFYRTVWYAFTPETDGTVLARILTATFTPVLAAFTGSSLTGLTELGCQNNTGYFLTFHVNAGTTYYFQTGGLPWGYPGSMQFHLEMALPPANDNFTDAIAITSPPFDVTVDTTGSTLEAGEPVSSCQYNPSLRSVWYAITPAVDEAVYARITSANINSAMAVFTGGSLTGLTEVGCARFNGSPIIFQVTAGTTYYFQLGNANPWEEGGSVQFHLELLTVPANDNFADATIITSPPFYDTVDTMAADLEADEPTPACASNGLESTVWYAFTPAYSESFSASVPNAAFIPVLAAFTGSSLSGLTELGCRYYTGNLLTFHANTGTTYYFQVSNLYHDETGSFMQFHLEVAPSPVAGFWFTPPDPSIFDTIQFYDQSNDPANVGIQSWAWNFGDGATAEGAQPAHLYKADGDYTVQLTVTTYDGRTATASQVLHVSTHDVAITKITAPPTAKSGQAQKIIIAVKNRHYAENVQVDLYKSVPGGFQWVGAYTQFVPVRMGNQTSTFTFNYTFTADDAKLGKVSFKAVATIVGYQDVLPTDNELISSPPTKVTR